MKTLLVAIHGILTSQTDPSWPDQLDAWMYQRDPKVKVLKKEYRAGPFPRWNCWIKDPLLARGLVNEIELFLRATLPKGSMPSVWFVAHSNGAVIALRTVERLIELGHNVAGIILTGAACEADIDKNHVGQWLREGKLGCAIAYSSAEDQVLPGLLSPSERLSWPNTMLRSGIREMYSALARPYGSLGRTGWLQNGKPIPSFQWPFPTLQTRWFAGGHSTYFTSAHIDLTFEQIRKDITLNPRH
jgi:pimeloyl-ACP methyl ester carboxylesterase